VTIPVTPVSISFEPVITVSKQPFYGSRPELSRLCFFASFQRTAALSILMFAHYARAIAPAEEHRNAPDTGEPDQRIDYARDNAAHSSEYRGDKIELE
jgi:hypothetical protein